MRVKLIKHLEECGYKAKTLRLYKAHRTAFPIFLDGKRLECNEAMLGSQIVGFYKCDRAVGFINYKDIMRMDFLLGALFIKTESVVNLLLDYFEVET